MNESFDPLDYDFVLLPKLQQQTLDFYELKSHSGAEGMHDFSRVNVYLCKDGNWVHIWYGAVDSIGMDIFFEKNGVDFEHHEERLFRGYIITKDEANVILPALDYRKLPPVKYYIDDKGKLKSENLP